MHFVFIVLGVFLGAWIGSSGTAFLGAAQARPSFQCRAADISIQAQNLSHGIGMTALLAPRIQRNGRPTRSVAKMCSAQYRAAPRLMNLSTVFGRKAITAGREHRIFVVARVTASASCKRRVCRINSSVWNRTPTPISGVLI